MLRRRRMLALTGIAAVAIIAVAIFAVVRPREEAYAFNGGEFDPPAAAAPIPLVGEDGKPFSVDDYNGEVLLVYFGYTTCPDLCPTTLSDFMAVKDDLGDEADKVRFVFATVDPDRDSLDRIEEYLAFFDPSFIGLRGDDQETEAAKQGYGVVAKKVDAPGSATGYLVDHTSLIYLIDPQGRLRLTYAHGTDPAAIAEDVRHLV